MQTTFAVDRRYLLFCGAGFVNLLRKYVVKEHVFRLTTKDGSSMQQTSRFANLRLSMEAARS